MFTFNDLLPDLTIQDLHEALECIVIVVGGILAYYRFFKGRIYYLRLEPKVEGIAQVKDGVTYLTVTTQLKNIGLAKVEITRRGTGLRIRSAQPLPVPSPVPAPSLVPPPSAVPPPQPPPRTLQDLQWQHQKTLNVFDAHQWIESGETIEDQFIFALPASDQFAFYLELRIVVQKIAWKVKRIVTVESKISSSQEVDYA